ncbi:MAG: tRNA-binding protein [Rubricoccaceae bacterium]
MDFTAYDLRTGTIVDARAEDDALRLVLDFGSEQRSAVARITERYTPADLQGRQVVAVVNPPGALPGTCVVLAAISAREGAVLVAPEHPVPDGTPVV